MSSGPNHLKIIEFNALDEGVKSQLTPCFEIKFQIAEAAKGAASQSQKKTIQKTFDEVHEWMKNNRIAGIVHCPRGYQLMSEETHDKIDMSHSFLIGAITRYFQALNVPLDASILADYIINQRDNHLIKSRSYALRVVKREDVMPEHENMALGSKILQFAKEQMAKAAAAKRG